MKVDQGPSVSFVRKFSIYWLRLAYIELDGDQVLDFFWIDPIDAAKRFISKPKFAGKLTEAAGGISTRGPWAGRVNAARNEEISLKTHLSPERDKIETKISMYLEVIRYNLDKI